jgi:hypothetical protein
VGCSPWAGKAGASVAGSDAVVATAVRYLTSKITPWPRLFWPAVAAALPTL